MMVGLRYSHVMLATPGMEGTSSERWVLSLSISDAVSTRLKSRCRRFSNGKHRPFGCGAISIDATKPKHKWLARDHDHPAKIFRNNPLHRYSALSELRGKPLRKSFAITTRVRFFIFAQDRLEKIRGKGDLRSRAHESVNCSSRPTSPAPIPSP